jgi:hypothetical protein
MNDDLTTLADILPPATISDIEELIDLAIMATSDAGIDFHAGDAESLMARISNPDQAAAELRELARLIEHHGAMIEKQRNASA